MSNNHASLGAVHTRIILQTEMGWCQMALPNYEQEYNSQYYKDGDTFSPIVTLVANGYVTAGTKSIVITIPVDKSLKNINTITVSRLYTQVRGQNGYINSTDGYYDFSADSSYTIEATKSSDKAVRININKSTAYTNIDNNTLVSLSLGGQTKLTFRE